MITRILHLDNIVNSKNFHFGISFLYYIGQTIILVCTKDKKSVSETRNTMWYSYGGIHIYSQGLVRAYYNEIFAKFLEPTIE